MKDFYVEAGRAGTEFTSFFAVLQRQVRRKKTGEPYLALVLADRTGQIEARMWDGVDDAPAFDHGAFVKVQGCLEAFNNRLQIIVRRLRVARPEEVSGDDYLPAESYLPATERNIDELWTEVHVRIDSMRNVHLQQLLRDFLDDPEIAARLRRAPAARSLHHARLGGLLEHKAELMDVCDRAVTVFQGQYGGLRVDRDLLLAGAMLHDIGKVYELSWDGAFEYTVEGQLLGHISIGLRMMREKMVALPDFPPRLALLLEHMLLSHHGHYEFGSPKLPMTAEAMMLHMLDDLCAKMELFRGELKGHAAVAEAAKPTGYIRALERPILDSQAFLAGVEREVSAAEGAAAAQPHVENESALSTSHPVEAEAAQAADRVPNDEAVSDGMPENISWSEAVPDGPPLIHEAEPFFPAAQDPAEARRQVAAALAASGLPGMVRASSIVISETAAGEAASSGLLVED